MNALQVLDHFDRISDAPDAIPRLRRFILDLAVRGKLVEQDRNDEPASELLKRIQAEKARLVKDGKIGKQSLVRDDAEAELPFRVPELWEWTPATYPTFLISDLAKKIQTKDVLQAGKFPVVDQGKMFIRGYCNDSDRVIYVEEPVIIFGDHTRETKLVDFDFVVGADGVKILKPIQIVPAYYFLTLQWLPLDSRGYGRHFKLLRAMKIPLPPLAEQHRIVAKVNELMALCDRLEAAQAERENRRDGLAAASLHRLNNGANADEFREHARFHLRHLPRLTTRPEHIQQLRQTILNLAVRGKLVKAEGSRVTAEQIEILQAERLALCQSKAEHDKVTEEFRRLTAELRGNTEQTLYIKTLCACQFITKGTTPAPNELLPKGDVPFIKVYNIVNNKLDFNYRPTFISRTVHEKFLKRSVVRPGDVLMNIVGPPLGKVALVTSQYPEWNINQALVFFRPLSMFNNHFIALSLSAPITIEKALGDTRGTVGQDNLSLEQVRSLTIPLITLENQQRTAARVNELMALSDRFEAQLAATQTESRRLLEAVLDEALHGAS